MRKKRIMEKAGAGGRPKAIDMWEHVTVLEGKKKVKCKYCRFEFAASANRIKSHIHRIEGKGIRICPEPEKIMRVLKEKKDLPDSQGLLKVDKSRDYNKPHETMLDCYMSPKTMWEGVKAIRQVHSYNEAMLDCYMSPKTMWEGIKAIRQVHTYNEAIHKEGIKVGPFYVSNIFNECDLQLIRYVFQHSSDRYKVFSSSRSFLDQSEFTTLRPQTHLDSLVIDIFADILTDIEKRKESKPFNLYLPEMFSRAAINDYFFVDFIEKQKMRENYIIGDLNHCEKIFIPAHVEKNSCGHYYLYIIHMKNREVEIWDSLCPSFLDETERDEKTQKLLCAMEELFGKDIMFTKFDTRIATNILLQRNGYDCGIFVINYMQQSDNYVRQNLLFQFDSDKERLDLALKLIKSDLNGEKEELYNAARSYAKGQSEEALDLCSIRRKRLDLCKTVSGDVEGQGADRELDDSDNRDEKRKNVGLKTDTAITEVPCGLELLVHLRCLNLKGAKELKISSSAISKMTNLRSLLMNGIPKSMVTTPDIQGLRKLEVISVNFCDIEELNVCVKGILGEYCKLKKYCLSSGLSFGSMLWLRPLDHERKVILSGVDLGNRDAILPKDINELIVSGCDHWTRTTYFCHALSFHTNNRIYIPRIERLDINKSKKLEYLCCMSADCSFCHCVQLVGTLSLFKLTDLKQIVAPYTTPPWASPFVHLMYLYIYKCRSMKIVMTSELLAQLQNLDTISIRWCESIEEIVEENYCSGNTSNPTIITLPKLASVELLHLPKLNSVFKGTLLCPSLKIFGASSCEKLSPPDIEIVEGHNLHLEIELGECYWEYDPIEEKDEDEDEEDE